MTAELPPTAKCFCLKIKDIAVAFAGVIHFPHAQIKNIKKISRMVVLPDYQGFGFSSILADFLGDYYKGYDLRISSSNPSIIGLFNKNPKWFCTFQGHVSKIGLNSTISKISYKNTAKKILTTFKFKG